MQRVLPIIGLLVLMGCQDKIICAAFQSTYILDDSTRNAYYSYVWQLDEATRTQYLANLQTTPEADSLLPVTTQPPTTDYYSYAGEKNVPWRVRGRTKFGIVKYEPYWLKKYRMRTAPMENVYSPKPPEPVETDYVATEVSDSVAVDSLGVASLDSLEVDLAALEEQAVAVEEEEEQRYLHGYDPQDNFNVEQEYYNKYYGEKLIDRRSKPDAQALQAADSLSNATPDSLQDKKFSFKGLFKKKSNEPDSTQVIPEPEVEETNND
ncbi:MAG: hypothetical protein ABJG78_04170 [Cyclobacteriaceae bacterium]